MDSHSLANGCSFCGKGEAQVGALVAGPAALRICDECIESSSSLLLDRTMAPAPTFRLSAERSACCSFCGMKANRVWKLLQGVGHSICSECVELANLIAAGNDDRSANRSNVEALQQLNKKRWVWDLSWGGFRFMVRWR